MMYTFKAHRISSNDNILYPDIIMIDENTVHYSKGTIIGYKTTTIPREEIAAVDLDVRLFFADVTIFSSGNKSILATGFSKKDAKKIAALLRNGIQ